MGSVIGRTSSMPGSAHALPQGETCDSHANRLAVARIQGETDSFGAELVDMCEECLGNWRAYKNSAEASTGTCDWCKSSATDLKARRDVDEGSSGPVYQVCGPCRTRDNEALYEELAEYDDFEGSL